MFTTQIETTVIAKNKWQMYILYIQNKGAVKNYEKLNFTITMVNKIIKNVYYV